MRQVLRAGALGRPRGVAWGRRWEGRSGWGTHVNPWLIHVNVWQKPLKYCKVISLQLIKINEKKKRNAGLEEAQVGIKIAGRNINNLRYTDDTTLMVESEEEIKCLLVKVKEEREKFGLKLNIQKTKIMASSPIT